MINISLNNKSINNWGYIGVEVVTTPDVELPAGNSTLPGNIAWEVFKALNPALVALESEENPVILIHEESWNDQDGNWVVTLEAKQFPS